MTHCVREAYPDSLHENHGPGSNSYTYRKIHQAVFSRLSHTEWCKSAGSLLLFSSFDKKAPFCRALLSKEPYQIREPTFLRHSATHAVNQKCIMIFDVCKICGDFWYMFATCVACIFLLTLYSEIHHA